MTTEERVSEWVTLLGSGDSGHASRMCSVKCMHPDCAMAKAILAALDEDGLNDTRQDWVSVPVFRDRIVTAIAAALGIEGEGR